jgi:hypothetical protein
MGAPKRAISAIYCILYTVHIGPQRAALSLPLLLNPMDPLPIERHHFLLLLTSKLNTETTRYSETSTTQFTTTL